MEESLHKAQTVAATKHPGAAADEVIRLRHVQSRIRMAKPIPLRLRSLQKEEAAVVKQRDAADTKLEQA